LVTTSPRRNEKLILYHARFSASIAAHRHRGAGLITLFAAMMQEAPAEREPAPRLN